MGSLVNLCGGFVGFCGLCVFCALSFWVGWWLSCALVWCGLRMIYDCSLGSLGFGFVCGCWCFVDWLVYVYLVGLCVGIASL